MDPLDLLSATLTSSALVVCVTNYVAHRVASARSGRARRAWELRERDEAIAARARRARELCERDEAIAAERGRVPFPCPY